MKLSGIKNSNWFKFVANKYVLIIFLFVVWMLFFDTNSFLIHNELNTEIDGLENNKEFYQKEIEGDKTFIKKMKDSNEIEKYAREKYYLKKENEDIYIIVHEDSLKKKKTDER